MVNALIVSSEFPPGPGGIGYHAYSLALSLFQEGFNIFVLSAADYSNEEEVKQFDSRLKFNIQRYRRKGKLLTYVLRIIDTYRVIKEHKISVVLYTGKFSLWQSLIFRLTFVRVKNIVILHGSEVNLKNLVLRKFTHYCISRAQIIVSVSKFTESLLPQRILNKVPHAVIPNGVFPVKNNLTSNYHLTGNPVLLTVGHVSPRKGQHQVIAALPKLLTKYPDLKYHIIGRPIFLKQFQQLSVLLGVDKSVIFHGTLEDRDELLSTYRQADVFMLLSENLSNGDVEGFGIVALEANQNGVPVIGSLGTGVEAAVCEDYSGYLVDAKDSVKILEALDKCISNKDRLSQSSVNWAESHDWKLLVKHYLDIIR